MTPAAWRAAGSVSGKPVYRELASQYLIPLGGLTDDGVIDVVFPAPMSATVLVAEDHPAMREMIVNILQRHFDVVSSVKTGPEAVDATNNFNPEVLVLDLHLPGMDGRDVAMRLKDQGLTTKIVFISVSMDATQVPLCFAAGGDAYVYKMRMASDLNVAVSTVLRGGRFVSAT